MLEARHTGFPFLGSSQQNAVKVSCTSATVDRQKTFHSKGLRCGRRPDLLMRLWGWSTPATFPSRFLNCCPGRRTGTTGKLDRPGGILLAASAAVGSTPASDSG